MGTLRIEHPYRQCADGVIVERAIKLLAGTVPLALMRS